jgi:hypothetical protein
MCCGILGIIPLFGVGLVCAIVGLVLSTNSKKKSQEAGMPHGMATAGIVCSSIGCGIAALYVILAISCVVCYGGIYGCAACTTCASALGAAY